MSDVTRLIDDAAAGDPHAAAELLPLVYEELRKLAAVRLADEKPGQTLQATALVHEAYLRLVGGGQPDGWSGRGHFFAAAAEAMRRILVDNARRRKRIRHGGGVRRIDIDAAAQVADEQPEELLDLDEALGKLEKVDAVAASVVSLSYFGGLTLQQTAEAIGLSLRTTERNLTFARTWLHRELKRADTSSNP